MPATKKYLQRAIFIDGILIVLVVSAIYWADHWWLGAYGAMVLKEFWRHQELRVGLSGLETLIKEVRAV